MRIVRVNFGCGLTSHIWLAYTSSSGRGERLVYIVCSMITKGLEVMAKSGKFNKSGIDKIAKDKPVVYRIETEAGKTNYIGSAGRGNVQDRLNDHLGTIPGAQVRIQQFDSVQKARESEARAIKRDQPKYNEQGK